MDCKKEQNFPISHVAWGIYFWFMTKTLLCVAGQHGKIFREYKLYIFWLIKKNFSWIFGNASTLEIILLEISIQTNP